MKILFRKLRKSFILAAELVKALSYGPTGDFLGLWRWVNQSVHEMARLRSDPPRRLLVIYDLTTQPFSMGDILVIQEASLVVREQYQLGQIDFVLLYDPAQPACADPAFASIDSENILYHVASVLPAAQVNPHHGSLFAFNSPAQLLQFIADNVTRYHIWPSVRRFRARDYNYLHVFNDLLHNHYLKHGSLPRLTCRPFLVDWAHEFYRDHVFPAIPVTVQIRKNKIICPSRNLQIEYWLDFFRQCETDYPVRFVIIGSRAEVDNRLRACSNVVVAKDQGTTVEQDLALIQTAAIHMGASSGPAMLAVFNPKPYLIVNTNAHTSGHIDFVPSGPGMWKFRFATPYQRCAEPPETKELLVKEFARMWSAVDQAEWKSEPGRQPKKSLVSWLR
jgi:hypothetical protein